MLGLNEKSRGIFRFTSRGRGKLKTVLTRSINKIHFVRCHIFEKIYTHSFLARLCTIIKGCLSLYLIGPVKI